LQTIIQIDTPPCIDGESLKIWLKEYLSDSLMADCYLMADKPFDCVSQSDIFSVVEVDFLFSREELMSKSIVFGKQYYFYIKDVVSAAIWSGSLPNDLYHVYYKDSH